MMLTGRVYYWRGYPSSFDDDGTYRWVAEDVFQQGTSFDGFPVFQHLKQLSSQEDQENGESGGMFEILLILGMTNCLIE